MNKPKRTTRQVVEATARHYGIHPDRIRQFKRLSADDYIAKVPQATTMAQGLAKALGNSVNEILEEIPRKHRSGVAKAHDKLEWNVAHSPHWKRDCESILQAL